MQLFCFQRTQFVVQSDALCLLLWVSKGKFSLHECDEVNQDYETLVGLPQSRRHLLLHSCESFNVLRVETLRKMKYFIKIRAHPITITIIIYFNVLYNIIL